MTTIRRPVPRCACGEPLPLKSGSARGRAATRCRECALLARQEQEKASRAAARQRRQQQQQQQQEP